MFPDMGNFGAVEETRALLRISPTGFALIEGTNENK